MRGRRTQAREIALKVLYQLDITGDPVENGLKNYFKNHRVSVSHQQFVTQLVQGACEHRKQIDGTLSERATNWTLKRMAIVDRNILRLGAFELLFDLGTPPKVVINEAVELAKRFGTTDSRKFVNGVLDAIHKTKDSPSTP